jgi:hypothetical protein
VILSVDAGPGFTTTYQHTHQRIKGAAVSAPGRQSPARRRGRGASPGAGRGHRPATEPRTQQPRGQVGPSGAHSSLIPSPQLPLGWTQGANGGQYFPPLAPHSDRAAGLGLLGPLGEPMCVKSACCKLLYHISFICLNWQCIELAMH